MRGRGSEAHIRIRRATAGILAGALVATALALGGSSPRLRTVDHTSPTMHAFEQAHDTGQRVELTDLRTEDSETYADPDGTQSTDQHLTPVRVGGNGSWRAIDTTLVTGQGGVIQTASTGTGITVSPGGTGPIATLVDNGHDRSLGISWPTALPAPTLSGDTATYAGVLPGVDLTVRATNSGIEQNVVIRNRDAAANPALRKLTYTLHTHGVSAHTDANGITTAVGTDGGTVFASDTPLMFDSATSPAEGARAATPSDQDDPQPHRAPMSTSQSGDTLTIVPNQALLTATSTVYPVVLDPAITHVNEADWTQIDKTYPNQSYWDCTSVVCDRTYAKTGYEDDDYNTYRSLFDMPVNNAFWHKHILSTSFSITLAHSWPCRATRVDLWSTKYVSRGTPVTWNANQDSNTWWGDIGNASAYACDNSQSMTFGGSGLLSVVQRAANGTWGTTFGLGLRAPNENVDDGWKRFNPGSIVLSVTYNTTPNMPTALDTVPPKGCGTSSHPVYYNTLTPTYSVHMSDADANGSHAEPIHTEFQITDVGANKVAYDTNSVTEDSTPGGVTVQFPPIPAGVLVSERVYTFYAATSDGTASSAWTAPCWFVADTTPPDHPPTITGLDWGEFGPPVGTPGQVGFGPNGVADIGSYRYGVDKTLLDKAVPAAADSTATAPLTLWDPDVHTLYVQSVDKAGNPNTGEPAAIKIQASRGDATPAHRPGDVNGDGLADLNAIQDAGNGHTLSWSIVGKPGGGFYTPTAGWNTLANSGFAANKIKVVKGDFDGDGFSDLAVFRDEGNLRVTLWVFRSDGDGLVVPAASAWDSGAGNGWGLANMKVVAGDFNGDGRADIAAYYDHGNAHTQVWLWTATGSGFGAPVSGWDSAVGRTAWAQVTPLAGDFDGDGKDDLVQAYRYADGSFTFWTQASTGTGFADPASWYTNPAGWADPDRLKLVAGDVNHDGRADIVDLYDYGNAQTKLWVYPSTGSAFGAAGQVWDSGPGNWSWAASTPVAGDLNGDGATDLTLTYAYPDGHLGLWTLLNTGGGLPATFPESWSSGPAFPLGGAGTEFL